MSQTETKTTEKPHVGFVETNPIRQTIIRNATVKIAAIIAKLEHKEDRGSVMLRLVEMFCDCCGGRQDDDALTLDRHLRCDCVIWADE